MDTNQNPLPENNIIPIVPLRDGVVFPHTEIVLTFGRPRSIASLESAFSSNRLLGVVMQKEPRIDDPSPDELYQTGTICQIDRMLKGEGEINVLVRGIARFKIDSTNQTDPFIISQVSEIKDTDMDNDEITALCNHLMTEFRKAVNLGKSVDFLVFMNIMSNLPANEMADQIASTLSIKPEEKQQLLEEPSVLTRLKKINEYLTHETKILEIERNIAAKTQEKFDKNVRDAVLRERMKTIEKELGESVEDQEFKELRDKINKMGMPEEVKNKADKELKRLMQMSNYNPEASYVRTYLDWLTDLPWSKESPRVEDIKKADKILNQDHYGLEKIKERIIEYLAVLKLKHSLEDEKKVKDKKADKVLDKKKASFPTILCFVGPPGVGKTSLGKSIARALNRTFVKVSLGGIRDEAEIRGHRRTYVGAMPGRIIQGIKQAGTKNPVFMLDEVDKLGADFRGDPSAALLEALDPEQNYAFSDHYMEVPFDLSDVMFITTCNVLDTIPPALRDRLEIIHFAGYTSEEKFHIARDYLWKKQISAHGLNERKTRITEKAIKDIIQQYTREAGVRNLERRLATICRKIAKLTAMNKQSVKLVVSDSLHKYLGPAPFTETLAEKKDEVGMSTGLAWTEAGGDILFIEVALMPGRGNLTLTGQLGDVMKESAQAAMSYVRSKYKQLGLAPKFYQKIDVHIHVPEGAVPKDGPSAGIAITSAIISALTKVPCKKEVGMTGEITLRGRVLEIGGIKEKVIAAHRAGLKLIIMPKTNKKDLEEIPKYIRKDMKFVFVEQMDEVIRLVLTKDILKKNGSGIKELVTEENPEIPQREHLPIRAD